MKFQYKSEVNEWIENNNVNCHTISFYSDLDGNEVSDCEFTTCDVTGEQGNCAQCCALDNDGNVFEFYALDAVIGDYLGKIAGAF